jgi:D-psicose/D-tagatose/L-ribulose 3-epimerase
MDNKVGVHALVWVTEWTPDSIKYAVQRSAETGYDFIEAVIFDPAEARPEETARTVAAAGIECVTGMALNGSADISSPDPEIRKRGEQFIADAILATRDMGSTMLGGVTHSAMQRYPTASWPGVREELVATYGRLARNAEAAGVHLGIEVVNRYESNVVNTIDDAAAILETVGSKQLFLHIDSYHMNIEEHDVSNTILRNHKHIGYVHVGESNRGYLGGGSVDFETLFRALHQVDYRGPIGFEAFSPAVLNDELSNALAAWRAHWTDSADLASHALGFIRSQLGAARSAQPRGTGIAITHRGRKE